MLEAHLQIPTPMQEMVVHQLEEVVVGLDMKAQHTHMEGRVALAW